MKNRWLLLMIFAYCVSAYSYTYNSTPAGSANPPEIMEQDPNIPVTPNVYKAESPLSKETPPGTLPTPGVNNKTQTYSAPAYPATQ